MEASTFSNIQIHKQVITIKIAVSFCVTFSIFTKILLNLPLRTAFKNTSKANQIRFCVSYKIRSL